MDLTIFLIILLGLLGGLSIAVSIYLILVLNEARSSLRRFNSILDHIDSILGIVDEKIARPASALLALAGAIKEILEVFRDFSQHKKGPEHGEPKP